MSDQQNDSFLTEFQRQDLNKAMGLREFLGRYMKYLPWVLISVTIAVVLAKLKIRYTPPIYRVQSQLLINNDRGGGKGEQRLDDLIMFQPPTNLNNEIEILRSRPLMARVVKDLGLQYQYYNKGSIRSTLLYGDLPFTMEILQLADSLTGLGFNIVIKNENQFTINEDKKVYNFDQPFMFGNNQLLLRRNKAINILSLYAPKFTVSWSPLTQVAEGLSNSIRVSQINNYATILTLSQETPNTKIGVAVLNTTMAVYDTTIVEDKNQIANQTLRFIDNRLDTLHMELGGVQGALRIFMERSQAFNLDDQSKAYMSNLEKNADNKIQQDVQIKIVDLLLDYVGNAQNNYKTVPVNLGISEPSLLQLINEYNRIQVEREATLKTTSPGNPLIVNMEATLEKLRNSILEVLRNVRNAYLISKNRLEKNDSDIKSNIAALPGKSMQALNIERQQKILEDLYSFLLQKKLETTISSASTISNSKVIEPAIDSTTVVSPDSRSITLTYILLGLIIPISIITLIEVLNDKVNSRAEIERSTQAPILGEIGHSDTTQTLVVTHNSRSFVSEQFRIIRSNLQYIIGKKTTPTILVTSSFSGEGKSFISTNMGAVMALTGKRTVIMEFDIRKPKILSGLDLKRKMGITNYIIGKASFDELPVAVAGIENLFVIPCGPIPPNPAEILLDPRLNKLMEEVKENFDIVIMDTAPIGLVSDAINLSQFADCTFYIVRNGYTMRRLLGLIQELYSMKKLPSLSILLNDIRMGGYYGGYYGGYGYGSTYGQDSGYFEKDKRHRKSIWKRLFGFGK
jgi:tyrosine-protein kinase Etk/Wzc